MHRPAAQAPAAWHCDAAVHTTPAEHEPARHTPRRTHASQPQAAEVEADGGEASAPPASQVDARGQYCHEREPEP